MNGHSDPIYHVWSFTLKSFFIGTPKICWENRFKDGCIHDSGLDLEK